MRKMILLLCLLVMTIAASNTYADISPSQIATFDDFTDPNGVDFWTGGDPGGYVSQGTPPGGVQEGTSCLRVQFENFDGTNYAAAPLREFSPAIDLTKTGDSNNPGTSLTLWVWTDLFRSSRVNQLILIDSAGNIARGDVPQATVSGWRNAVVPLQDMTFDPNNIDGGPTTGPADLTDIVRVDIWFDAYDLPGNSVYVDDLWIEDYVDPGQFTLPHQISSLDNVLDPDYPRLQWKDDYAEAGLHDQWLFQETPPIDGPAEGSSCVRVKFENWVGDPNNMTSTLNRYFTPSLDLTQTGDTNNPGTALSFWYYPDVVGDGKVTQMVIGDSSENFAYTSLSAPTDAGWQQVIVPLEGFVPHAGDVDLTDIWMIQLVFSNAPGGGNSVYVDDIRLEEYVPPPPPTIPYQIASFDNFAADGWQDDYEVGGLHGQWLFQDDPNEGPVEGSSCVRVQFENWSSGDSTYSTLKKNFAPSLDLIGDPNDTPNPQLTYWVWSDLVGNGKVNVVYLFDPTSVHYAYFIPPALTAGWQKVTIPLKDFILSPEMDLTDVGVIYFQLLCDPGGGNSIYIDDLWIEEDVPVCTPTNAALIDADFGTITVDGDPSDWASLASDVVNFDLQAQPTPEDNGDLNVDYSFAWDYDYLYILVEEQAGDTQATETTGLNTGPFEMNDLAGGDVLYDSLALFLDFDDDGTAAGANIDAHIFLGLSSNDANDVMMTWTNGNWGPHDPAAIANGKVQTDPAGSLGTRITEAKISWADLENALGASSKPVDGLLSAVGPGYMFGADPRLNDLEESWGPYSTTSGGAWFTGELWTPPSGFDFFSVDVELIIGNCDAVKANGYKLAGDIDGDCSVGIGDVVMMAGEWLSSGIDADIVDDDNVDLIDFAQIGLDWLECNDPTDMGCTPNWPQYVPCGM